jgi:hypothetical protein
MPRTSVSVRYSKVDYLQERAVKDDGSSQERHKDVMHDLDAQIGLALLWVLPPALASVVAAIHAERDAAHLEVELARFLSGDGDPPTSVSSIAPPRPGSRCMPPVP